MKIEGQIFLPQKNPNYQKVIVEEIEETIF